MLISVYYYLKYYLIDHIVVGVLKEVGRLVMVSLNLLSLKCGRKIARSLHD